MLDTPNISATSFVYVNTSFSVVLDRAASFILLSTYSSLFTVLSKSTFKEGLPSLGLTLYNTPIFMYSVVVLPSLFVYWKGILFSKSPSLMIRITSSLNPFLSKASITSPIVFAANSFSDVTSITASFLSTVSWIISSTSN